jgi:hypothetical protein
VDIEEEERRRVVVEHAGHVAAVLHLVDDRELGPQALEARAQLSAQQRLVVGDHRAHAPGRLRGRERRHRGTSMKATTPWGAFSSKTRRAEAP